MLKIVGVGGKVRGQEFTIDQDKMILGRDNQCSIHLDILGISKKHLQFLMMNNDLYIEDLGSANGTFVNGKIIKGQVHLHPGDKVALPDAIFQVVFLKENKVFVAAEKQEEVGSYDLADDDIYKAKGEAKNLLEKILFLFRYQAMNIIHKFNFDYEWRHLIAFFIFVFVLLTVGLTIRPVLQDTRRIIQEEFLNRAIHYADEIGRINARAIEQNNIDAVDTNFLDREPGVESYTLFDLEGRIFRPISQKNTHIQDSFSVAARSWAVSTNNDGRKNFLQKIDGGKVGVAQKISVYNPKIADHVVVAVIAIVFAPKSITQEATRNSKAYLESIITSSMVAILIFGIIYYLTIKPVEELRKEIEDNLRGKKKEIDCKLKFEEFNQLKQSIFSIIQRNRELNNDDDASSIDIEDDFKYVQSLKEIFRGVNNPAMVLNSEKKLQAINSYAEDLTGIRESSSVGLDVLEICREQGFAATLIELCDQSASSDGSCCEGEYELSGIPSHIYVSCLIGKDQFAKAYFINLVKNT